MAIETLYENQWLSLMKVVDPEKGVNGYIFSHETRCQGIIIAVLPFRRVGTHFEYLVKSEVTPCWGMDPVRSALTGGYEGESTVKDAQRELEEESGFTMPTDAFIPLGESYASKSSDTRYALYAIDLTGVDAGEAKGDGTALEASAESHWLREDELFKVDDPQVHVMYNRLRAKRL